jgi:hypothetical protein
MKSPSRFEFILMAIIVVVLVTSPMAFGQMGMMGGPHKPAGQMESSPGYSAKPPSPENFKERLGLTDEQAVKFAKLWSDYRKETIKKQADIQVAGIDLSELMEQKKVDMGQLEKKLRQLEDMKTDLMLYRVRTLFKAKEFLNEDQFEKLKSFGLRMMHHKMMMGQMGHGMMDRGMMKPGMMDHPEMDSSEEGEE